MTDKIPDDTGAVPLDSEAVLSKARQATCMALERRLVAVINDFGPRHSLTVYELQGVLDEVKNSFLVQRLNAEAIVSAQRRGPDQASPN